VDYLDVTILHPLISECRLHDVARWSATILTSVATKEGHSKHAIPLTTLGGWDASAHILKIPIGSDDFIRQALLNKGQGISPNL